MFGLSFHLLTDVAKVGEGRLLGADAGQQGRLRDVTSLASRLHVWVLLAHYNEHPIQQLKTAN